MKWVTGVTRNEAGRLCISMQDLTGKMTLGTLKELSARTAKENRRHIFAEIDLADLHRIDTRHYLDTLGLGSEFSSNQAVYEYQLADSTLIIPVQFLILALLSSDGALKLTLMTPLGENCLKVALNSENGVHLHSAKFRQFNFPLQHESIDPRLRWILCYPSATRAWGSVYRNALSGRFDMDIPAAKARLKIYFKKIGGRRYVTSIIAMEVHPTEAAHPYVGIPLSERFVFKEKQKYKEHHMKKFTTNEPRLSGLLISTSLTDAQWEEIEPIVRRLPCRTGKAALLRIYPLRALVSAIVLKYSASLAWSAVSTEEKFLVSVRATSRKLRKAGLWEEIVAQLRNIEQPKPQRARQPICAPE